MGALRARVAANGRIWGAKGCVRPSGRRRGRRDARQVGAIGCRSSDSTGPTHRAREPDDAACSAEIVTAATGVAAANDWTPRPREQLPRPGVPASSSRTLILILLIALPLLLGVAMTIYADRKVWAAMQLRRGPNVVGPFGLLQRSRTD